MPKSQFKVGDRVEFNVGKLDGPIGYGVVTVVSPKNGSFIVAPQGGQTGQNVALFNIKKRSDQ